ncbi:MAG: pseudouridine synthase [Wenzhouxiangella sp.]|jgi:23S rRNA pseudouridine2605 synthase|nr:pseudouridine synthase [Wenzhouxiangella sp.]
MRRTRSATAPPETIEAGTERLQKVLARAGLGSRRSLESRIERGEILVNKVPAKLGSVVGNGDLISLDQREFRVLSASPAHRTLIYHKPEGEVTTTSDPEGRRTVFDRLPRLKEGRWISIGRLDLNTAGLLLLTTDGELANRMMHPSGGVDREYLCRIRGMVSDEQIQKLRDGVELEDGPARFSDIVPGEVTGGHSWYTVVILEGRNREVRRLWEAVGVQVARLKRVRFGPVFLPAAVRPGRYQELSPQDHRVLREDADLPPQPIELILQQVPGRPGSKPAPRRTRN